MRLDIMVEGQEDVTWPQWLAIAEACERHGIGTLWRSDHYLNLDGKFPERGSLDALGTMAGLAAATSTVRLGTLVSPATFRHPSEVAKLATTIDHISGGRFELGLGAGWHEREHTAHGFEFHDLRTRVEILAEQLEIVHGHWAPAPFSFRGRHYTLEDLDARPKPVQRPHPPLIMGGAAMPKVAALAARFADEYNTAFRPAAEVAEIKTRIDAACQQAGREPMPVSLMTAVVVGSDQADVQTQLGEAAAFMGADTQELVRSPPHGWLIGTVDEVTEQLLELKEIGLGRVMCQRVPSADAGFIETIGRVLAPRVAE